MLTKTSAELTLFDRLSQPTTERRRRISTWRMSSPSLRDVPEIESSLSAADVFDSNGALTGERARDSLAAFVRSFHRWIETGSS